MRLLLDTHFLVWLATNERLLRAPERRMLESVEHEVVVSTVSIWELRIKDLAHARRGGSASPLSAAHAIAFATGNDIPILAPEAADYAATLSPPLDHGDPFDEMLLVHAQQLGARLLTRDARLIGHALAASPV
jgi:PIN domain nuclease of toxin-antitoxin system